VGFGFGVCDLRLFGFGLGFGLVGLGFGFLGLRIQFQFLIKSFLVSLPLLAAVHRHPENFNWSLLQFRV